jgi:glycerol transport system ATP-binding protein
MNLLEAEIDGHVARVGGQLIELGAYYAPPPKGSKVQIGFRPDFAVLAPDGGYPVRVQRIEDLGRRRIARVALGPHEIFATLPYGVSLQGEMAGMAIRNDRLFVYVDEERVSGVPVPGVEP